MKGALPSFCGKIFWSPSCKYHINFHEPATKERERKMWNFADKDLRSSIWSVSTTDSGRSDVSMASFSDLHDPLSFSPLREGGGGMALRMPRRLPTLEDVPLSTTSFSPLPDRVGGMALRMPRRVPTLEGFQPPSPSTPMLSQDRQGGNTPKIPRRYPSWEHLIGPFS